MTIKIHVAECTGCGTCEDVCPNGCIAVYDDVATIDIEECNECEACVAECPEHCISVK